MILRRIAPDDWAAFRDIRLEMLAMDPPVFGTPAEDWARKTEADIRDWLETLHAVGLFDGARLLGCAAFWREEGPRATHRATVISVYMRPEARGQGHMARILARLGEDARGAGIAQLELAVVAENAAARAVYERQGYRRIATLPRQMRTDAGYIDEELMILMLDGRG